MTHESLAEPTSPETQAESSPKRPETTELRAAIGDAVADLVPDARPESTAAYRLVGGAWPKWR